MQNTEHIIILNLRWEWQQWLANDYTSKQIVLTSNLDFIIETTKFSFWENYQIIKSP